MIVPSRTVPIESVRPNDWNPNEMPYSMFAFLKASIKKYGFVQNITVTEDMVIIDGEHRWRALKEMGEKEIEVKVLPISEDEARLNTVNFNALKGEMNTTKLGALLRTTSERMGLEKVRELSVLPAQRIGLLIRQYEQSMSGQDALDTHAFNPDMETDIKFGDILYLGAHRVMCGDATNQQQLLDLCDGERAEIALTDPPYNIGYKYREYKDDLTPVEYEKFVHDWMTNLMVQTNFIIVTPGKGNEYIYFRGWNNIDWLMWNKKFSRSGCPTAYASTAEMVLFIGEVPTGKRLDVDVYEGGTDRIAGLRERHACPKPIGLWRHLLVGFTDIGDTVLDCFAGSGTTLIAAEQSTRIAYVMERDPVYCQNIVNRWEALTHQKAQR